MLPSCSLHFSYDDDDDDDVDDDDVDDDNAEATMITTPDLLVRK